MVVRRGPVRVRAGHPIPTAGLSVHDRRELMEKVRREILALRA
jgi:hypothetical protein